MENSAGTVVAINLNFTISYWRDFSRSETQHLQPTFVFINNRLARGSLTHLAQGE
jgi:hypothetical protein